MATTKWVMDPTHSELTFKVKHMMISNVKGEFQKFDIEVDGEDLLASNFDVTVDISSINTNNHDRDNHLKSADFFDVDNHKQMHFKSTGAKKIEDGRYELNGELTIRGQKRPATFTMDYGGSNTDPWGNEKAGLSIEGKLNRKDFGLNWNTALEAGGVLVSDDVRIEGEIQFIKQ